MRWPWSKKETSTDNRTAEPIIEGPLGCLASNKAIEDGFGVYYMHRSEPSSKYSSMDSGWVFCHGTEDDEYVNNPSNWKPYRIETIAELFPGVVPHLNAPIGAAFYWDGSKFVPDPLGSPDHPPVIH
jgi:hypothetical protein